MGNKVTAESLGISIGTIVKRLGDDGKYYEYEVDDIDSDGECMTIYCENAFPEWVYIMADDCEIVNNKKLIEDEES